MRSALYYPHTTIRNEIVLKRALLLWDSIEYIVPDRDYKAQYSSTLLAEAAELVAEPHVPSLDEQTEAHKQIEDFATSSLPDAFFFRSLGVQGEKRTHRSEEHTSELQSLTNLVCRLL